MTGRRFSRAQFLRAVAGAGTAASVPLSTPAQSAHGYSRVSYALVLSGGGARGAYEAGVIAALARANNVADGQPLAPYEFVCGTSIGALNGWMVATGQYTRLRQMWNSIAAERILRIKPQYAAIRDTNSGIATRISQGLNLLSGLRSNVRGIYQSEPVTAWLKANVDPGTPVLMPFIWSATNLTAQRTEYFYRAPRTITEQRKSALLAAFRATMGPSTVFREAADEDLHMTLFASAAIPIVFDPVDLRAPEGIVHQYVDGGVASNTPVGLARTVARSVEIVLVDPPFESETYNNAVEIAFGVYGTMQRRLLENDIRSAFVQSLSKTRAREITEIAVQTGMPAADVDGLRLYFSQSRDVELSYIRPREILPVGVGAFSDDVHIKEAMQLGEEAGATGFSRYTLADFYASSA